MARGSARAMLSTRYEEPGGLVAWWRDDFKLRAEGRRPACTVPRYARRVPGERGHRDRGGFVGLVWGRDRRARFEALRVFVDRGLIEVPVVFMRLLA